ncbi:MAG: LutC/YkgG family protein [Acidimicrobiia bacterium]
MDRDAFLSRVGTAAAGALLPSAETPTPLPAPGAVDLMALFVERATAVNAVVHGPLASPQVPGAVEGIFSSWRGQSFVAWDELPVPGVISALISAGLERVPHEIGAEDRLERNLAYRQLDVGITGADAGLAESGSIVLTHGPGRPRMASLIPEVHVALLEVTAIHRSLAHFAQWSRGIAASTTNMVVVSGPSRTGDIELQLNLGVHGPRIVHIVLVRR